MCFQALHDLTYLRFRRQAVPRDLGARAASGGRICSSRLRGAAGQERRVRLAGAPPRVNEVLVSRCRGVLVSWCPGVVCVLVSGVVPKACLLHGGYMI